MVIRNVLIKWNISSSDSHHHLIASALNNLLSGSNKVDLALHMNDWNRDVQVLDKSLDLLLEDVVLSLLSVEWDWVKVEKVVTLHIKLLISHGVEVGVSISEMLVVEMLLLPELEKSEFLSLIILNSLEQGKKSLLLIVMDLGDSLPLLLEPFELHLSNPLELGILDVHI